jgi:hypothetical protein
MPNEYGEKIQVVTVLVATGKQSWCFFKLSFDGCWFLAKDKLAKHKVSNAVERLV